jgi:hypothetical protein
VLFDFITSEGFNAIQKTCTKKNRILDVKAIDDELTVAERNWNSKLP